MVNDCKDGVDPLLPGPQKAHILRAIRNGLYRTTPPEEAEDLILDYYVTMVEIHGEREKTPIPELVGLLWDTYGNQLERGFDRM